MQTNREYIDQIYSLIKSEALAYKEINQFLTEDYFKSEELKNEAKAKLDVLINVFRAKPLNHTEFESFYNTAIVEFQSNHPIDMLASASLKGSNADSWLTDKRYEEISWDYTTRYFQYLKKNGRSDKVIAETYRSSRRILEKLEDPKSSNSFYTRGLVVGSVQSGKTANFNAIINRSIDAGYGLIIVLAGIMEDLRSQTQLRIEKEVAGYGVIDLATEKKGFKGVGLEEAFGEQCKREVKVHQVMMPTSVKHDFKKTLKESDFPLNNKNILVCKKNTSVLKNLILWLDDYLTENHKHSIPLLIIDDEADNASLNNMGAKGKEYASIINGHIRALLGLFNRKAYLGYTATPFANVLQDRNDAPTSKWKIEYKDAGKSIVKEFDQVSNIFPDDFIELLFPPSNYIGAKHFFETRIEEINKIDPLVPPPITDYFHSFPARLDKVTLEPTTVVSKESRSSKKDDPYPKVLPDSLLEAIQCFIISAAIRLSRESVMVSSKLYNPHNTMLVHISRFTAWQTRTKVLIQDYIDELTAKLENDFPSDPNSVYSEFERTWYKHYAHVIENIKSYLPDDYQDDFLISKTFDKDIKPLLVEAIRGVEVKAINSETGDSLTYPEKTGKKYLAIGGNRLSRGFTLEGLTINYFIRNTDYADTLLQMGRWFGYRPGYLDCCKLFTTANNIQKFDLTTVTIEELEHEFRDMSKKNRKPSDFTLRVKTHPKVLRITRASILKNTVEEKVNFSGDIEQSTKFNINKARIEDSWESFRQHIKKIDWIVDDKQDFLIHKTDYKGLLEFLKLPNTFVDFETQGLTEWLRLCNENGKLKDWTIAIKRNTKTKSPVIPLTKTESFLPVDINLTIRRGPKENTAARDILINDNVFKASGKSAQIVAAGKDFSITLSDTIRIKAEKDFRNKKFQELIISIGSEEKAKNKADNMTIPDHVYRSMLDEKDGILVIYLIDLARVFEEKDGVHDNELTEYASKKQLNLKTPLIGYALGFPKISGEIGGTYIKGDYDLEEVYDEVYEEEEEFDDSLTQEEN